MQPKEFLIKLNVCRGLGIISKYRLWEIAAERYEFDDMMTLTRIANINGKVKCLVIAGDRNSLST